MKKITFFTLILFTTVYSVKDNNFKQTIDPDQKQTQFLQKSFHQQIPHQVNQEIANNQNTILQNNQKLLQLFQQDQIITYSQLQTTLLTSLQYFNDVVTKESLTVEIQALIIINQQKIQNLIEQIQILFTQNENHFYYKFQKESLEEIDQSIQSLKQFLNEYCQNSASQLCQNTFVQLIQDLEKEIKKIQNNNSLEIIHQQFNSKISQNFQFQTIQEQNVLQDQQQLIQQQQLHLIQKNYEQQSNQTMQNLQLKIPDSNFFTYLIQFYNYLQINQPQNEQFITILMHIFNQLNNLTLDVQILSEQSDGYKYQGYAYNIQKVTQFDQSLNSLITLLQQNTSIQQNSFMQIIASIQDQYRNWIQNNNLMIELFSKEQIINEIDLKQTQFFEKMNQIQQSIQNQLNQSKFAAFFNTILAYFETYNIINEEFQNYIYQFYQSINEVISNTQKEEKINQEQFVYYRYNKLSIENLHNSIQTLQTYIETHQNQQNLFLKEQLKNMDNELTQLSFDDSSCYEIISIDKVEYQNNSSNLLLDQTQPKQNDIIEEKQISQNNIQTQTDINQNDKQTQTSNVQTQSQEVQSDQLQKKEVKEFAIQTDEDLQNQIPVQKQMRDQSGQTLFEDKKMSNSQNTQTQTNSSKFQQYKNESINKNLNQKIKQQNILEIDQNQIKNQTNDRIQINSQNQRTNYEQQKITTMKQPEQLKAKQFTPRIIYPLKNDNHYQNKPQQKYDLFQNQGFMKNNQKIQKTQEQAQIQSQFGQTLSNQRNIDIIKQKQLIKQTEFKEYFKFYNLSFNSLLKNSASYSNFFNVVQQPINNLNMIINNNFYKIDYHLVEQFNLLLKQILSFQQKSQLKFSTHIQQSYYYQYDETLYSQILICINQISNFKLNYDISQQIHQNLTIIKNSLLKLQKNNRIQDFVEQKYYNKLNQQNQFLQKIKEKQSFLQSQVLKNQNYQEQKRQQFEIQKMKFCFLINKNSIQIR